MGFNVRYALRCREDQGETPPAGALIPIYLVAFEVQASECLVHIHHRHQSDALDTVKWWPLPHESPTMGTWGMLSHEIFDMSTIRWCVRIHQISSCVAECCCEMGRRACRSTSYHGHEQFVPALALQIQTT